MHLELRWILLVVTTSYAFPQHDLPNSREPQFARIVSLQNEVDGTGAFAYSYETENGIKAEARGTLNNAGVPDAEEQVVTGSFSFVADDGQLYSVTYIADSNGFRAFGDHLPPASYTIEARQTVSPPITPPTPPSSPPTTRSQSPASNLVSPPRVPSPQSPQPLPSPQTRTEQDDLAQVIPRGDIRGLHPPPPPALNGDSFPAGLVIVPTGRNPRQRPQEFYETIVY